MKKQLLKKLSACLPVNMAFIVNAILFSSSANGQIVYTDVNPDITVSCSVVPCINSYNLDLNNDGTIDFTIYTVFDSLLCNPRPVPINSLVIKQQVYVTPQSGNGTFSLGDLTIMMKAYDTISGNLAFHANQGMLRSVAMDSCGPPASYGNWTSSTDHYIGLQIAVGTNTYYGWARLNVDVPSSSAPVYFTVKDYAYNNVPNQPILAGQTVATGVIENSFATSINLFPNPATNHLTIALGTDTRKVQVSIADITGKVIYTTITTDPQKLEVNTNDFAEGVYVVQIQTEDFIVAKKLVVKK